MLFAPVLDGNPRQSAIRITIPNGSLVINPTPHYSLRVKFPVVVRRACSFILICLALAVTADAAQKPVRLRNQTPASPPAALLPSLTGVPVSGLFIVQFREPLQPAWREQLRTLGVDLIRYIPEDAYLARFENARPSQVRLLNYVQFVGEYRAEHKVHRRLRSSAAARSLIAAPPADMEIAVLLPARASDAAVEQLKLQFNSLQQETKLRSGRILRGTVSPAQLEILSASDQVLWIEPAPRMKLNDEVSSKIVAGDGGPNLLTTQSLGYDGSGVTVAVADSGLDNGDAFSMHPDLLGRTPAFFYYGLPGQLSDASDEHSHGTHVAGIIAGNGATGEVDEEGNLYGLGVAPGASIIGQRIFDGVGNYAAPPSFEKLTRDAKRAGADIGSNSWGDDTQGRYDISAMEFDELVRDADGLALGDQPYILEFSAGNAGPGPQTIGSPAVAKNVIATGACQNDRFDFVIYAEGQDTMADFSSRGPCEDGRIKPDVVAPGTWIASLQSGSATDEFAWAAISPFYQYQGGTSQAGPNVSGAAAVFVQYYRLLHTNATPSPALVKAALINSAVDMDDTVETAPVPNNDEGWGRVDLTEIVDSDRVFDFVDQSAPLTNQQVFERKILVGGNAEPLKVTLTYTDEPGFPGAIPALVNDLDLEVVAPNGDIYRGNQFDRGQSVANSPGTDNINNVEGVLISAPGAGEYIIRVRARNVVEDARVDTAVVDQDFALVTSGQLAAPGASVVFLDRNAYRAPDTIKLTLIDKDQSGIPSLSILVRSSTEPLGELFTLNASDSTGSFTGSVATVTGSPIADGQLQVTHNDSIEVRYFDASAGSNQISFARADLVPPVLTGVATTNQFGLTIIKWTSDEPASSLVRYDTNTALTKSVADASLTTSHAVGIGGLIATTTYRFLVVSTDEAGNSTTNNNAGMLFSFIAPTVAKVLLVNDYEDLIFAVPPLSGYTAPLSQLGISFDIWNTTSLGSPALTNLQPYRCVIWRLSEFYDIWSLPEQNALTDYLRQGGSVFVASMEVLTRVDELGLSAARLSVLHVQSFIEDNQVADVIGSPNDPIGNGIDLSLDYTPYEDDFKTLLGIPEDVSDTFTPESTAAPVFFTSFGETVGLKHPRTGFDAPGRVVFLSFPLDTVPMNGTTNNRVQFLGNILRFLVPGFDGQATLALSQPAYPLPGSVVVQVDDADQAGGSLNITYSSTTQPATSTLTLTETARAGTFRGTFQLVAATNLPAPGTLRVNHGDTIKVSYADVSSGLTRNASAGVDAIVPAISGVISEPDFEAVTIYWDTTEPCDSLVQFGESTFLNRTAFDPTTDFSHEITINGLRPDTTYYFQVVSRDEAGNAAVSNNNSNYFTFRTLSPVVPPWSDSFVVAATNWSTFEADGSQSQWTLGVPANGSQTTAHSPPNCWGSVLKGGFLDYTETFLISPAIHLTGGNAAQLTFWHNYDFSEQSEFDIFEAGTFYVVSSGGSVATPLAQYVDANFDWEQETIDLSPFAGQVVYFVWAHQLVSFDIGPRAGWLVDDVAVTVSTVVGGTIHVTNNLWQAAFFLGGPQSQNGKGKFLNLTNAPPGQYILEFADVLHYSTPPAQTNTLPAGGSISFTGNYTFADANTNGIPDGWELAQFKTITPQRTQSTDTDADGLGDWAEFVAGTDPNNPPPPFRITAQSLAGNVVQLSWPSVTNHSYRVHASTNAITWSPFSNWFAAAGTNTSYAFSTATNASRFIRVEAAPPAFSPIAPTFRMSATLLINNQVRLAWPSAPGHAYRLLASTNSANWSPFTDWIRASGYSTGLTLPPATNGAPNFFRIEAAP